MTNQAGSSPSNPPVRPERRPAQRAAVEGPARPRTGAGGRGCVAALLAAALLAAPRASAEPATPLSAEPVEPVEAAGEVIVIGPIDVSGLRERGVGDLVGADPRAAAADRALREPTFVTVVRVDERAGETTSVAEVLARTLGVRVRSLGGLGGFSSLSVRGADAGHTAVLVDGVPLSRAASTTADLGRYELESVSELELYRGGVPIELGGGGLGGALNLVTRVGRPPDGRRLRLSAGVGSFGARHLRARWLDGGGDDPGAPEGVHLSVGYAGAAGDFVYFNDNGTNLDPDDDEMVRRQNNAYEQVDAVARRRVARGDTTLSAGVRALYKTQGVPGSASVQSEHTSLETLSQLGDVSVARRGAFGVRHLVAVASAFAAVEQQRYRDLHGEIGLGAQHRRYRSLSAGGAARATAPVGARHVVSAGLDVRVDHFAERDLADPDRAMPRAFGRVLGAGVAASDEIAFGGDRLVVQPAVRVELLRTDPIADANSPVVGPMELEPRTDVYASPRVAARLRLAEGLVTKGSAGHYVRAPTLLELFGDRGFLVGNPRLRPESGLSADLGLVLAPARALGAVDRLYLESAVFGRRARDAIVFIPTAGLVTIARNHGDADIGGLEVAASARLWRTATVSGNYTLLATRQRSPQPSYDGKELPHRPRHQLYGRVDLARALGERVVVLWGDASVSSGNFLDPANTNPVPVRRLLGAGLKFEPLAGLLVGLEAKNLTDERIEHIPLDPPPRPDLTSAPRAVSDFFGYPLPGRSYYLTMEWTH